MNLHAISNMLGILETIARGAGEILLEGFGRVKSIEHKSTIDLVTEFDRRSESFIVTELHKAFPNHAILAEESGLNTINSDYLWIVDPLDGTTNFAHGFPAFAISIALTLQRKPIIGVVFDPLRNELYAAEVGRGATLNGRLVYVSTQADLGQALIGTGFGYDVRTNPRNNFAQFIQFQQHVQALRYAGSATLNCVWVAAGRLDGYWEFGTKPWDVAGGVLIVREAGGRVTTIDGAENVIGSESIVLSNTHIHAQMLQILQDVR